MKSAPHWSCGAFFVVRIFLLSAPASAGASSALFLRYATGACGRAVALAALRAVQRFIESWRWYRLRSNRKGDRPPAATRPKGV